jgi:hypothetical protein
MNRERDPVAVTLPTLRLHERLGSPKRKRTSMESERHEKLEKGLKP